MSCLAAAAPASHTHEPCSCPRCARRGGRSPATPRTQARVEELLGHAPGRALEPAVRCPMEARFGRDFGDVRIHDDPRSQRVARSLDAFAFTVGRDLVFAPGAYAPGSAFGRRVLAHELSHVAQAAPLARHALVSLGAAGDAQESAADTAADAVLAPTPRTPRLAPDPRPTLRRWKIDGNTAESDAAGDTLGRLAERVGARFNDWKCIRPLSQRTGTFTSPPTNFDSRYELYVQKGDTFDISNLTATTGTTLRLHLFDDGSEAMDSALARLFYSGSTSSLGADADFDAASGSGSTPISELVIFGHAGGGSMWGGASSFTPAGTDPEQPQQSFTLAEAGLFPRRCWFTRNARVRLVGCNSDAVGSDFAASYLRTGAEVVTTTRSVRPKCSAPNLDPVTNTCLRYDGVDFASSPSPTATSLDGPFWSVGDFHGGGFWTTIAGTL